MRERSGRASLHPYLSQGASSTRAAFTLIEVLVVVAIIALLVAILMPSLAQARQYTKVTLCKANSKQIGTLIATYQSEHQDYVPVLFNYYYGNAGFTPAASNPNFTNPSASGFAGHPHPQRTLSPAVAMRKYSPATTNLKSKFINAQSLDPEIYWDWVGQPKPTEPVRNTFESQIMPDHFACPFIREDGDGWLRTGQNMTITGALYDLWEWRGRHESYQTWARNTNRVTSTSIKMKYSAFSWHTYGMPGSDVTDIWSMRAKNAHRRWKTRQDNIGGGLSDITVVFCAQGSFSAGKATPTANATINNYNSHRTTTGGGTNAIFADTHVEWVPFLNIGMP